MKMRMSLLSLSLLLVTLLLVVPGAGADPDLSLQDTAVQPGAWAEAYAGILEEKSGSIQAYQEYVQNIASVPVCHPVGFQDLNGDGTPEMLFLDLEENTEYGFKVGRLWIYTADGDGAFCALSLQPEIDDLLYSQLYLAGDGALTFWLADTERGWRYRLRQDVEGHYTAETILMAQEDFSGEGPDEYFMNGKKITQKQYQKELKQLQTDQGQRIESLMIDEGGSGFTHTLQEAREALSSGSLQQTSGKQEDGPEAQLPKLVFRKGRFTAGEKFAVYSAPSAKSWRGAKGKAAITSGSEIFVAGEEDGWMLILYELDSGVIRAGYIDTGKISGDYAPAESLSFPRLAMKLTGKCEMTEDPIRQNAMIGTLKKGAQVTCLARYRNWIYAETTVSGKKARGFIEPSALGW